jgi:hypothetical protein
VRAGDEDAGLHALEEREGQTRGSAIPLLLAQLLTSRAQRGRASAGREAELQRASELALRARDRGRAWGGSTVRAIVAAADAFILSHDPESAWQVLREAPEGEATATEATDPDVLAKAAIVAASSGRTALARELAAATKDPFEIALIAALIAEEGTDDDDAGQLAELWQRAYEAAATDEQRMFAARGLRALGVTVPDYDKLQELYPDAVAEAEELAGVFGLPIPERIARLRALRNTSNYAAFRLAHLLDQDGDGAGSATVLIEAADRFGDQGFRVLSARKLGALGSFDVAKSEVEAALAQAPDSWSGRSSALAVLLDISSRQESGVTASSTPNACSDSTRRTARLVGRSSRRSSTWASTSWHGTPSSRHPFRSLRRARRKHVCCST